MAEPTQFGTILTGQIQIFGGPPVSGYALTSDANGVGTWQPIFNSDNDNVLQMKLNVEVFG